MAIRYARPNELGLVIAPPMLDCLQEECPTALVQGRCFVDVHHLYFPNAKFANDPLTKAFAEDPFNKIRLPRCMHNSRFPGAQHSMIDAVTIPSKEVMHAFLFESKLLRSLGNIAGRLDAIYESLTTDNPRLVARDPIRYADNYEQYRGELLELDKAAMKCEVIPFRQRTSIHCLGAASVLAAKQQLELAS